MNGIAVIAAILTCTAAPAAKNPPADDKAKTTTEMTLQKQYLNIPIKNRGGGCRMTLTVDGKLLGQFGLKLAEDKPDWWAFFDVGRFKGKKLGINITPAPKDWKIISQDNVIKGAEDLYKEKCDRVFEHVYESYWGEGQSVYASN